MLYHYLAVDKDGKAFEGDLDAESVGQVLQYLAGKELRPMSVKQLKETQRTFRGIFGGIKTSDKVFLTKYLSLMLRVGTDLLSAIDILIADFDKPAMKNLLLEIRDNLSKGRPFYETFAHYPRVFSPVFVNLVKAAEASGGLQQTFEDLSETLQSEADLANRVRSAFVYPIILLGMSVAISTFLVTFAIPRIAGIFTQSGITPPLFSRIVFSIGLFLNANIFIFLPVLLIAAVGGGYFFFMNPIGKRFLNRFLAHTPLVQNLYRELAIQRFAATMSALMKAGLPILQTCRITADVVGHDEIRDSLVRIADEGLAKGLTIGEAFKRETVFPRVVSNLVAISEKAGHLDEVLETLSRFYASNIDARIRSLVAVLEPLLLMVMGLVVGAIAISIIVPIYQLTTQF